MREPGAPARGVLPENHRLATVVSVVAGLAFQGGAVFADRLSFQFVRHVATWLGLRRRTWSGIVEVDRMDCGAALRSQGFFRARTPFAPRLRDDHRFDEELFRDIALDLGAIERLVAREIQRRPEVHTLVLRWEDGLPEWRLVADFGSAGALTVAWNARSGEETTRRVEP